MMLPKDYQMIRSYSILQDKVSGTFWFKPTECGVNKFNGNKFTHIQSGSNESANFVFSMTEDKENNIWVANRWW